MKTNTWIYVILWISSVILLTGCSSKKTISNENLPDLWALTGYTSPIETADITVDGKIVTLQNKRLQSWEKLVDTVLDKPADFFDQVNTWTIWSLSGYKFIYTVPSLDTPVCTRQTKEIEAATKLFPTISFVVISHDTPFALKRFCAVNGINNLSTFSDARTKQFATNNGFYLPQFGLMTRAITIVDPNNRVIYVDYSEEVTHESDIVNALWFLKANVK